MEINCEIILDVLPLYAEGMISNTTREITDAHLRECDSCSKALEQIRSEYACDSVLPEASEKRLKRGNRRRLYRRWLPMLTALCLLLTLVFSLLVLCIVPVWMTAEEANLHTEETVANLMRLSVNGNVHGHVIVAPNMAHPGKNYPMGICCYGYRLNWMYKQPGDTSFIWGKDDTLWYRGDLAAEPDTLIHGDARNTMDEIVELEKSYGIYWFQNKTLLYVCWGSLGIGVICFATGFAFRKGKYAKHFSKIGTLLLCCFVACIFVTGGRLLCAAHAYTEFGFLRRYLSVAIMTALYWGSLSCVRNIFKQRKRS